MRSIPAELQAHLDGNVTTTCRLLKITIPDASSSGSVDIGLTNLDVDVVYDDGDGEITYSSGNGFDPATLRTDLGISVDNTETTALLAADVEGITPEMINAGALDDASWVCYLVNYRDLAAGHAVLGSGDVGNVVVRNGIVWIPELLDLSVRLKQPIGHVTSRKCRAVFGRPATQENGQFGCGVDISGLWVSGEVDSVGAEADREFTGDAVAAIPSAPVPQEVINAGFETGDLTGWTPDNPEHWVVSGQTPHSGSRNVEYETSETSVGVLETTAYVSAAPGQVASATCYVHPFEDDGQNTANGRASIAWYTADDTLISESHAPWAGLVPDQGSGAGSGAGNDWRKSTATGIAPEGTARVRVRLYAWISGGDEPHFDDVSLSLVTRDASMGASTYPAIVQFLTGDNAGGQYAVEMVDGMDVALLETTRYPIQAGDTYRMRPDCAKRFLEDCIGAWANGPNFKGEPFIPDGSYVAAPR